MSTLRTTRKLTPTSWNDTVVATVSALIAIAVVVALLGLTSGSRGSHTTVNHQTPVSYPLIQYRGTGAAPASTEGTRPTTPAARTVRKSYGAVS